jgi:hypothetical protein
MMLRELTFEEIGDVSGGNTTEYYVDGDGEWLVTHDDNGNFLSEVRFSDSGSGGFGDSGSFGCFGGGALGGVAGGCFGSNPFDAYAYAGVGTPGLSINGGYATDTSSYLTGLGGSVVGPSGVGAGMTADGQNAAVVAGTPGASVTYGVSISDTFDSVVDGLSNIANEAAAAFVDQYYPDLDNIGQPQP